MNMTELSSHLCWYIICIVAVWPQGPVALGASLCNARNLSCLVLNNFSAFCVVSSQTSHCRV